MALRHMSRKLAQDPSGITSAREVADCYGLPFEITAKTLQRLKDTGLIQSAHGARGGYTLQRALKDVSLAEFLGLMEGPQGVVACVNPPEQHSSDDCCEYGSRCEIKKFMGKLNAKVSALLSTICLAELADGLGSDVISVSPLEKEKECLR
jgi:Rrf2 family protein